MDEETIVKSRWDVSMTAIEACEFALSRRAFVQTLGAGLLITVTDGSGLGPAGRRAIRADARGRENPSE